MEGCGEGDEGGCLALLESASNPCCTADSKKYSQLKKR